MSNSTDFAATAPVNTAGLLRLRTLTRLRWLAVIGQTFAVLLVHYSLGFPLPLAQCLLLISLSAVLNILLTLEWPGNLQLSFNSSGILLGYDIAQLAGLLFLTGGMNNPFAFLFLVPVTVSATSLPLYWTLGLSGFAFLSATLLTVFHMALPWDQRVPLVIPATYTIGMWAALAAATIFAAIYARRIAVEARQMSLALTAAELVLARGQRLNALDGLAAAAAHELGTPLATIALVSKELKREIPANSPYTEDIDLLISQAARCREILAKLSSRDPPADMIFGQVKMAAMIEDLVAPLRGSDVVVKIDCAPDKPASTQAEPVFRRNPAITYGLGNLLENALDFAKSEVRVQARWSNPTVSISVMDDGPGFDPAIISRLGDPFVTTRPGYDPLPSGEDAAQGHQGMGLGLFIAKTLLERTGATVAIANRKSPEHGALITVIWPRSRIDVPLDLAALSPQIGA
jgi:two-component system, sensor histidine kinase RegB